MSGLFPRGVLYVIVCGTPVAGDVGVLVEHAQRAGWDTCVITTPDGRKFVNAGALASQTGHPVRTYFKSPGDLDVLPPADAMIIAPATVNTISKWACGIADTLALGLVIEAYGLDIPLVTVPFTNNAMAAHPAFLESLQRLRSWGVTVLFGDNVVRLHAPGTGDRFRDRFPWRLPLVALHARLGLDPPGEAEENPIAAPVEDPIG